MKNANKASYRRKDKCINALKAVYPICVSLANYPEITRHTSDTRMRSNNVKAQGLVAIFLLFNIFHIMYDYTIKGANDEKIKI